MSLRSIVRGFGRDSRSRVAVAAAGLVAGLHLVSQLVVPDSLVSDITQVLLMPALAAVLLTSTTDRGPLVRGVTVALFFSWLGDTLPRFVDGDPAFLCLVAAFLVAQGAYIRAFWPHRDNAPPWRRCWPRLPYLAAFAVLVVWCAPGAGVMLAPVIVYGLALAVMAMLSTGLGAHAGIGGAIFMLSDSLIALDAFADVDLLHRSFWVMLTYIAAQALIVAAVIDRSDRPSAPLGITETRQA